MRAFMNLPIPAKLGIGFGVPVLLTLVAGVFCLIQLAQTNRPAREVVQHHLPSAIVFGTIDSNIQQVRAREFRHMLAIDNAQEMQAAEEAVRKNLQAIDEAFKQYEASITTADDRQTFEELKSAWSEYVKLHQQLLLLNRQGKRAEADRFVAERMRPLLRGRIDPLIARIDEQIEEKSKRAEQTIMAAYHRAQVWTIFFICCAALLSFLLGWGISRYMVRAVRQIVQGMEELCLGDLNNLEQAMKALEQNNLTVQVTPHSRPLSLQYRDEFGVLTRTYNTMLEALHQIAHAYSSAQSSLRTLLTQLAQQASCRMPARRLRGPPVSRVRLPAKLPEAVSSWLSRLLKPRRQWTAWTRLSAPCRQVVRHNAKPRSKLKRA